MRKRYTKDPFSPDASLNIPRKRTRHSSVIDMVPEKTSLSGQQTLKEPIIQRRAVIVLSLCFLILSILVFRLIALQGNANEYVDLADNNRIRIISEEAPRGIIYDRNGIALTKNSPDLGVFVSLDDIPSDPDERDTIFNKIHQYTDVSIEDIRSRFEEIQKGSSFEPVPLIDHITHDQAIMLSLHIPELSGISISPKIFREYPTKEPLSHILGYTGKITEREWETLKSIEGYTLSDSIGKSGIEQKYESILKGVNGLQRVEVNALGHISKIVASEPSVEGTSISLAVDQELQAYLYEQISQAGKDSDSTGGAGVILNPQNGEVLALVSWPSYDANLFSKGITQDTYTNLINDPMKPLFNRPVSGEYASGSTIKPLIAAAALEEGIINKNSTINSVGGIQVGIWSFPDWKAGGHGITTVTKAIAESVNTFFYAIGGGYEQIEGLGVDRIRLYAEKFGLNNQLGIDIPGESDGFLPTKEWKEEVKGERWYVGDTYHLAIGQGDLSVTPLQIASYTSTIANGGTIYTPHLLRAIEGELVESEATHTGILSPQHLQTVREGMRQTVLSGSARSLQSVPVSVAGKTGTAQFGSEDAYHAWFTGFAPYENPQIAITILLEGGGEGSSVAVPVVKNVLTWWANNRQ